MYVAFEDSFLSEIVEVQELIAEPVPKEKFVINYTKPGSYMTDFTATDKNDNELLGVSYFVGKTTEETQQNRDIIVKALEKDRETNSKLGNVLAKNSKPVVHWILIANAIGLVVVGAYFAYRRTSKYRS